MEFIRTLSVAFDAGNSVKLGVESRSGTVSVRGDDVPRVRIEVVARLWAEDDDEADDQAELIRRGIQHKDDEVSVRTPALLRPKPFLFFGARGPKIDYQITVPKRTEARIDSKSGQVEVDAIAGPLDVESSSGKVAVRDITADVRIQSRSGAVQVEAIRGTLEAETRSGTIRAKDCAGDTKLEARSGTLVIENVRGRLKAGARSGSVRYDGPVLGSFDIDVTSGSVRLLVDPDSRFFLDAEAVSGSVTSDLHLREDGRKGPPPKNAPKVRIRTVSGSIRIGPN